jgi:hypothetical protein
MKIEIVAKLSLLPSFIKVSARGGGPYYLLIIPDLNTPYL